MRESRFIAVGGETIGYTLIRRKMKNIRIRVNGDGELAVSCSPFASMRDVERVISKNVDWIKEAKQRALSRMPDHKERNYFTGEKYLYLGKEHILCVGEGDESVRLREGYIFMTLKDIFAFDRKKKLLDGWYYINAKRVFEERFYALAEKHRDLFPAEYRLKIRKMSARWGSCMIGRNTVVLNFNLIYADVELIDYVILHELCHFRYRYHDEGFYGLLGSLCPDWKERKNRLNGSYIYYSH